MGQGNDIKGTNGNKDDTDRTEDGKDQCRIVMLFHLKTNVDAQC